jgi:hypothetical protein
MKNRLQLLERKSKLCDEIQNLEKLIDHYTWDDAFTDAPVSFTNIRIEYVNEKRKKEQEITEINKLLK